MERERKKVYEPVPFLNCFAFLRKGIHRAEQETTVNDHVACGICMAFWNKLKLCVFCVVLQCKLQLNFIPTCFLTIKKIAVFTVVVLQRESGALMRKKFFMHKCMDSFSSWMWVERKRCKWND